MLVFCSWRCSLKSDADYPVLLVHNRLQHSLCTWETTSSLIGAVRTAGSGSEEEASDNKKSEKKCRVRSNKQTSCCGMNIYGRTRGHCRCVLRIFTFCLARIAVDAPQSGFCRKLYSLTNPRLLLDNTCKLRPEQVHIHQR